MIVLYCRGVERVEYSSKGMARRPLETHYRKSLYAFLLKGMIFQLATDSHGEWRFTLRNCHRKSNSKVPDILMRRYKRCANIYRI